MNKFLLLVCLITALPLLAQEVKTSEDNQSFNAGSKNSIVVNIPYGQKDIVERQIKKEMKDWNGKYDYTKGEFTVIQGTSKFMGDKPFDAFAKIVSEKEGNIDVAFAIDLGGAFLSSKEHSAQFRAMSDRIRDFARETSLKCIEEELDAAGKVLSGFEKDQRGLEKDNEGYHKDIEEYKQKITAAEQKIEQNVQDQSKKKEEIKSQEGKIAEIEKKKKGVK